MVNVSRNRLPDDVLNKIYQLLLFLLKEGGNREDFFIIMNEFFSPKEKILFAKRITVIYLLLKGIAQKNICEVLNVSNGTVSKYSLYLTNTNLKLVKIIKLLAKKEKIFETIDNLLADFLIQPGIKMGHWKLYWEHKRKNERRETYGF
ncbi:hypothetical protein CO083_02410 [Candidatus Roizmanbacteria bacterium CG_4_9_14_0_8_um_filter_34_12]|uniref:Uncharacterized protein n=6 Tax=Candidatus Roizmaniibacteriota TaxID=1752723 RepID=A0A2M7BVL6_9BACT|nr:MAG: hypothetical protein COW98_02300 [Candidatus Roizmanbacteria bacterium CG22_combo_CG10-13_8_21_14_all_35_9]PIQ72098.1 MAG: hypothetical protein COV86_04835 [Candidatus Roizmanbacteria bacterium CG11_big_fil_rev_8_21_14_0_20_35_14]PIV10604.1 MAG: hypothetical protein COS50_04555 [Candidatus Roizmanbacteria bacterium CG03_land_8_20_14_0_80_35_26]PIY71110.1 MAG: hypothetical protein COY88_02050 [Candidatus Roizmanbacteria bacterium CG_4_10_14_0_8_um_filter_35_28]PJB88479.1 MAG: hypothetica